VSRPDAAATRQGSDTERAGILVGVAAYGLWGLFPLYFHLLDSASAVEVLCHRILWSLVVLAIFLAVRGERGWLRTLVTDRSRLIRLAAAAVLIAINWVVYVWAVGQDRVVEGALGYFICPLVTVLLGVGVLRERLRSLQWAAVGFGACAVVVLTVAYGHPPWIALTLAVSFAAYGYIKKHIDMAPAHSLAGETAVLAPAALAVLVWLEVDGTAEFGAGGLRMSLLLAGTGIITVIPLALFAAAASRIPLSMLGLLQYLTPTTQFVIAVTVFGEVMTTEQWAGFGLVWVALVLLSIDAVRSMRAGAPGDELLTAAAADLG
jgi:chloramphenicol-sensitive protein RarD